MPSGRDGLGIVVTLAVSTPSSMHAIEEAELVQSVVPSFPSDFPLFERSMWCQCMVTLHACAAFTAAVATDVCQLVKSTVKSDLKVQ